MNIEIKNEKPIGITLDSKASSPIIKVESHNNVNTQINRQDIELQLQKHPELAILFETKVISGGGIIAISQEEYDKLATKQLAIYAIFENDELARVYIGETLFAQRSENGFFSYSFPIIF